MRTDDKPIGYWLKRADEAITQAAATLHEAEGLSRLHWQVFNTVAQCESATAREVFEALRPFAQPPKLERILRDLEERGWLEGDGDGLTLTETGRTAHGEALKRQRQLRTRLMKGVSADEYETVLRALKRITANLDEGG